MYPNSISIVFRPQIVPNKTVKINVVFVTGVPCLQHVFDEDSNKKRYSGGSFLTINLKKTNLAPVLNRKLMTFMQPATVC